MLQYSSRFGFEVWNAKLGFTVQKKLWDLGLIRTFLLFLQGLVPYIALSFNAMSDRQVSF